MLFEGSETSSRPTLLKDSRGRSLSRLVITGVMPRDAGVYVCNPASSDSASVNVHVANTTVLAIADSKDGKEDSKKNKSEFRWLMSLFEVSKFILLKRVPSNLEIYSI